MARILSSEVIVGMLLSQVVAVSLALGQSAGCHWTHLS